MMSQYQMVLAHIYTKDPAYREFYQERVKQGDFVLLDNSAYEMTTGVDYRLLGKIAEQLNPTAVVLPDKRFDADATIALAKEAHEAFKHLNCKLVGVPQGNDMASVMRCYDWMAAQDWIDGFGIYEEIGEVCGIGKRYNVLQFLEHTGRVDTGRYYHLLGMEEDVSLVEKNAKFNWVSGIDSVKPVVYGLYGIDLTAKEVPSYPHRPQGYFDIEDLGELESLCLKNIVHLNVLAASHPSDRPNSKGVLYHPNNEKGEYPGI